MTDKQLLELAAKAAGIELTWNAMVNAERHPIINYVDAYTYDEWNPLTDDGDALRLAVKLSLDIYQFKTCVEIVSPVYGIDAIKEYFGDDNHYTTRRAIVRAAAEIGKEMKP
jgi:hypothetical protein